MSSNRFGLNEVRFNVFNAAVFQLAWPVCVFGGSLVAGIAALLLMAMHLFLVQQRGRELIFLIIVWCIGYVCDMAFLVSGVLINPDASVLPPLWLSCLWLLFGTTVGYSLQWFHRHLLLSGLFAGAFAPLSYLAGTRLTAVDLLSPVWLGVLCVGLSWAVILPVLILVYRYIFRLPGGVRQ